MSTRTRRAFFSAVVLASGLALTASSAVLLDLNASSVAGLLSQGATRYGDLVVAAQQDYIDFGSTGWLRVPAFPFPADSFTVEAMFMLDRYASVDPYVCSIIGAFDWTETTSQGIDFRVGGGYLYPLLPAEAYVGGGDFIKPDGIVRMERATLSSSMGAMVLGTPQGYALKEVYSNVSIPQGEWTHLVGTWDGDSSRVYVNGRLVTDNWRLNGPALPINIRTPQDLGIGTFVADGGRHFNGKMRFVRIQDRALTSDEVMQAYTSTFAGECRKVLLIERPLVGQCVADTTLFKVVFTGVGNCAPGHIVESDSLVVVVTRPDAPMDSIVLTVQGTQFRLRDLLRPGDTLAPGVIYVHITGKDRNLTGKRLADSTTLAAPAQMPVYLVAGSNPVLAQPSSHPRIADPRATAGGLRASAQLVRRGSPTACTTAGRLVPLRISAVGENGELTLTPSAGPGVVIIRVGGSAAAVVEVPR
jgi:hypothetical protein